MSETLADRAELWWTEQGNRVPKGEAEWLEMYEGWVEYAFADFETDTEKQDQAIDELADDTAMYLFRILGLDYDSPDNRELATMVRRHISLALDGCVFIVTGCGKGGIK